MTKQKVKEIGKVLLLQENTVELDRSEDARITDSLLMLDIEYPIYVLLVSGGNERATIVVGDNEPDAETIFERFVSETVSPCTVNDIFMDMLCEKIN